MKKTQLLGLTALGLLATAAPARAQTNYCFAGQAWTCFSYQLTAVANGGGGTDVTLSIRNTSAMLGDGTASGLVAFAIYLPSDVGTPTALNPFVTTSGTVGTTPDVTTAGNEWSFGTGASAMGLPGALELASTFNQPWLGSIVGCGGASQATVNFNTCGSNSGWVVFNFHTSGNWAGQIGQFDMGVKWISSAGSFECTTGAPSQSTGPCNSSVTPEPITLTLLGTGLAGMGGFGMLRRRKREDHDVA